MNAAAVFAPEKVYRCSGSVAFNCVPKFQFAATARTRLTGTDIHGVPPRLREVRRRYQIVPMKKAVCTIMPKAEVHSDHPPCWAFGLRKYDRNCHCEGIGWGDMGFSDAASIIRIPGDPQDDNFKAQQKLEFDWWHTAVTIVPAHP